jgi:hypothetical protein
MSSGKVEQQARRVMRLAHDLSVVGLNLCHELTPRRLLDLIVFGQKPLNLE